MNRKIITSMVIATSLLLTTVGTGWAVTLEVDLVSEGEPVPNAEITFETEDGEAIDLTLVSEPPTDPATVTTDGFVVSDKVLASAVIDAILEGKDETEDQDKTENGDKIEPPKTADNSVSEETKDESTGMQPDDSAKIATDGSGKLTVSLGDKFQGKKVYMVIKSGGRVVRKEKVALVNSHNTVKVDVPATAFVVTKTQAKKCKAGVPCQFDITVINHGLKTYKGPLAISDDMPVSTAAGKAKDWQCADARRGQTLCVLENTEIAPGASVKLPLALTMRSTPSSRKRDNCARVLWPQGDTNLGKDRAAVQLLQLGANLRGHNAGRADGAMGKNTRRAFGELLKGANLDPKQMTLSNLMTALGWDNLLQIVPVLTAARACMQIKTVYVARSAPRSAPKGKSKKSGDSSGFFKGLSIGIGIERRRGKHKEYDHYDD